MSIQFKSIIELNELLNSKAISVSELTQESIQLAKKYSELNCFVTLNEENSSKKASTIKRDTRRLISVGSGFQTKGSRTSESIKLLSWGFRNTDTFQISKMGETKFNLETWIGKKKFVEGITLKKKDVRNFKVFLDYTGPIIAPIKQGQEIGKIKIFKGEELLKTAKVFASEDIKKINFFKSVLTSINYMIWGDV